MRDMLGVEVAYVTSMDAEFQRFQLMVGDGTTFGVAPDTVLPIQATYCSQVLAGRLPNVMADLREHDVAMKMPITGQAGVGAFVSLPLEFSDGELYGTLCAASHDPQPQLGDRDEQFLRVFARLVADQIEHERMQERVLLAERELAAATALTHAVEARDAYTGEHSRAVVGLAVAVGERLALDERQLRDLARVALLHDIGKIAIPDAVLNKPGALDEGEWELMRQHPIYGAELIARTPGVEHLAPAVRAEHERWDGAGYPDGLAGEEIPLASRIVLACDAYHAMISDRPYRRALEPADARAELLANAGTQFSPAVVAELIAALDQVDASA
jgi:HD-GYP domain-containing protein (c-di-GMP phosphodiesterase class II)